MNKKPTIQKDWLAIEVDAINLTFPIDFFNDESLQSMNKKPTIQKDWLAIGYLFLV